MFSTLRAFTRHVQPWLRRGDVAKPFRGYRLCSGKSGEEPPNGFFQRLLKRLQTERGQFVLGNFSYCLQFAGFICTDLLPMRSFLIGGSMSFVCYALVQPKKLWIPAVWESTFASIHAYKIYEFLFSEKITLSADEIRLYALMFSHHQLDPHAFKRLVAIGQWATHKPGDILTTEGEHVPKVRLLVSGQATVHKAGELIFILKTPGNFIGEMSLMEKFIHLHDDGEEDPSTPKDWAVASATVTTKVEMSCFEWDSDILMEYLEKDADSGALVKAFFEDVMIKMHGHRDSLASLSRQKRLRQYTDTNSHLRGADTEAPKAEQS